MKKKFACTKCHFLSQNRKDCKRHCETYTGVKAHKCNYCGNCFSTKANPTKHIKSVHTKENAYECDVCEKMFFRRSDLLQHVKAVHDKIKSFICKECDNSFAENSGLKRYKREIVII